MTYPLVRVGYWSLPLFLCGILVLGFTECFYFFLWKLLPLHVGHKCSTFSWWIFPLMNMKCHSSLYMIPLVESLFYWMLGWQLLLVSWDHFLGRTFSTLLLWNSACVCYWGVFLACSKMLDLVCISSLLACLFNRWVDFINIQSH